MGQTLRELSRITLPDREVHNSRLFVDLCENIHIHYREFRIVFSLDEYFEFADIISRCTEDVRNYLEKNPDYEEGAYHPDYKNGTYTPVVMWGGGEKRLRKLLQNSPRPNESTYYPNDFYIELLEEFEIDEMHIHWRDFRFALPREHFKIIADSFTDAKKELEKFERNNKYNRRKPHHIDKTMEEFQKDWEKYDDFQSGIMGEKHMPLNEMKSHFENGKTHYPGNKKKIKILVDAYKKGERVSPILLSTESNQQHIIINGNLRYYAAKKAGLDTVNCIVTDLTFEESKMLREAEQILKNFDEKFDYKFNTSDFIQSYIAHKTSRYYKNHFYKLLYKYENDHFYKLKHVSVLEKIKYSARKWINKHPKIKSGLKYLATNVLNLKFKDLREI